MRFGVACVGGTFDLLHAGHKRLLARAFALAERVKIGVMESADKNHEVQPYHERRKTVIDFLRSKGWLSRAEVVGISDPFTPALDEDLEAIIVSPGTLENAERINELRAERRIHPLRIVRVPWERAYDGSIISSTAIRNGLIDGNGKRV